MINEIKNMEIEMKKILNLIVILFFGLTFAACGDDDEEMSNSPLIGTWTKQFQGVDTYGIRSYTFNADGTGRLQSWDWIDKKYKYQKYKWSATDDVIS